MLDLRSYTNERKILTISGPVYESTLLVRVPRWEGLPDERRDPESVHELIVARLRPGEQLGNHVLRFEEKSIRCILWKCKNIFNYVIICYNL